MLDPAEGEYQPRSGDGSIPAEDDSLRRQPADDTHDGADGEPAEDRDTERRSAHRSTGQESTGQE